MPGAGSATTVSAGATSNSATLTAAASTPGKTAATPRITNPSATTGNPQSTAGNTVTAAASTPGNTAATPRITSPSATTGNPQSTAGNTVTAAASTPGNTAATPRITSPSATTGNPQSTAGNTVTAAASTSGNTAATSRITSPSATSGNPQSTAGNTVTAAASTPGNTAATPRTTSPSATTGNPQSTAGNTVTAAASTPGNTAATPRITSPSATTGNPQSTVGNTVTAAASTPGNTAATLRITSPSATTGNPPTTAALDLEAGCNDNVCRRPICSCATDIPPDGLTVNQVPQFVMLTFDDAVNVVNMKFYRELLEGARRKNRANGCGIAATFFVSHEYLDYAAVNELHSWGNEIALHSIRYDSTLVHQRSSHEQPIFPYTMDFGFQRGCNVYPCPQNTYPGLWLLPMNVLFRQQLPCAMADTCIPQPTSAKDTFEFLSALEQYTFLHIYAFTFWLPYSTRKLRRSNFEEFYTTNRAPFPVFLHEAYLRNPGRKQGYLQFVDWLLQKDDVYLVTASEVLDFMQNPRPLGVYNQLVCPGRRPVANSCPRPNTCPYKRTQLGGDRYLRICSRCPRKYPWVGNPLGN
ncbi:hypothetical protein V5799_027456 [Amblyomma americanum]|uniref:Peritrophic membrane chitin binding protein n=1 Tax=Amblyomma americanum TaxID=6943 RepID=A0AAQ4DFN7_AMBAM